MYCIPLNHMNDQHDGELTLNLLLYKQLNSNLYIIVEFLV